MYAIYESDNPLEYFKGFQEDYQYAVKDGQIVTDEKEIPGGKIDSNDYIIGSMLDVASKMKEIILKWQRKKSPQKKIVYDAMFLSMDEESSRVKRILHGPVTSTMSSRNELLLKTSVYCDRSLEKRRGSQH